MRSLSGLLTCICAAILCAHAAEDRAIARARADIERLRALVEAGAAPRAELEKAEREMADASDAAFLRRTLYGPDLTEEQLGGMIEAAGRRLERRRQELAAARRLVEQGVASQLSLTPHLEELDRSRKEFDLAESRARLVRELTEMARLEAEEALAESVRPAEANALFDFERVQAAFESRWGKPLPVSALGDTTEHRAMGFDHRDRVDVAVHPDQPEGAWLRQYLEIERIPFIAFRGAVRGKATGAHIHIGPPSPRLLRAGAAGQGLGAGGRGPGAGVLSAQ